MFAPARNLLFAPTRNLRAVVVPLIIGVAIVGFLAGHRGAKSPPAERTVTVSVASVLLDYPATWRPVGAASVIPGLPLAHQLLLAPGGDASHAGLLAGALPGGEPSPLPESFVAPMRQLPATEVVNLLGNQAYRYTQLSIPGAPKGLSLYVIPNPGGQATALACYASSGYAADMRVCDHVVATLTLAGQSQNYELTPNPSYARQLTTSIGTLEAQRRQLRAAMSLQAPSATIQREAARLASVFARTAESLSVLEPSQAASRAQSALSTSLAQARDAYTSYAAAVGEGAAAGVTAAQQAVYRAEASVNDALGDFALLGYS